LPSIDRASKSRTTVVGDERTVREFAVITAADGSVQALRARGRPAGFKKPRRRAAFGAERSNVLADTRLRRPYAADARTWRAIRRRAVIHASDHHRASALMGDAYNAANRIGFNAMDQVEMFAKLDSETP
jgi:hypothetical protein